MRKFALKLAMLGALLWICYNYGGMYVRDAMDIGFDFLKATANDGVDFFQAAANKYL